MHVPHSKIFRHHVKTRGLKKASHGSTLQVLYNISLKLTPNSESGSRTIPIARFGAFEVRLVEFADSDRLDSLDLWMELYHYDTQSSIDSCLCRDLDDAENLGGYFISQAMDYANLMIEPEMAKAIG
jgi:hypothetical protein